MFANLVSQKPLFKNTGSRKGLRSHTSKRWRDFFGDHLSYIFAWFLFSILRFRRKVTLRNLTLVFPDWTTTKRRRVAFFSYWHFIRNTYDFILGFGVHDFKHIHIIGENRVWEALSKDGGLIILCAHLGNFELQAASTSLFFRKSYAFVKKVGGDTLNTWIHKKREGHGYYPILAKSKGEGARRLVEILQRKEILGFMMDQSRPSSPLIRFFNHDAKTNVFLAKWLSKHPTPVLPSYCKRLADGSHELIFFDPLVPSHIEGTEDEKILHIARVLNLALEKMILECPEQYFWMHRRWKIPGEV